MPSIQCFPPQDRESAEQIEKVDLPAPLGPTSATCSPGLISADTASSARTSGHVA